MATYLLRKVVLERCLIMCTIFAYDIYLAKFLSFIHCTFMLYEYGL